MRPFEAMTKNDSSERNKRRAKIAFAALVALFVAAGLIANSSAFRRSFRQSTPAKESLADLPSCRLVLAPLSGDEPIGKEIARQQTLMRGGPVTTTALERLGWMFVKKARLTFDAGYYKLAEQCAACMDATGARLPEALLLRAHALQSLHRFSEAETAARELVRTRERPFDYGVLGDVLIDQGRVREGAAAYQRMVDLRPDLQSYARAGHVRWLTGDLEGAIELMKLAVSSSSPNDPEAGAWAFTRLATYQLQRGRTKDALASSDAALALQNDYAPAMLARGRILLALNRSADALVELRRAATLNPLPEYQWALADVLRMTGNQSGASEIDSQIKEHGASEDPRSFSFYLATRGEHLDLAVQLAQQELTNRGDIFTHDALAWSLAIAGRTAEAQSHIRQALSERTADARLYLHAGIIAALNNENTQAKRWLEKADAMQQMLLPSEREQLIAWRRRVVRNKGNI